MNNGINMSEIVKQRCFQVPRKKLDLFLVKLSECSRSMTKFTADWVFENNDEVYDVVVNQYGMADACWEKELETFLDRLWKDACGIS